jgi:hypothetical protein
MKKEIDYKKVTRVMKKISDHDLLSTCMFTINPQLVIKDDKAGDIKLELFLLFYIECLFRDIVTYTD